MNIKQKSIEVANNTKVKTRKRVLIIVLCAVILWVWYLFGFVVVTRISISEVKKHESCITSGLGCDAGYTLENFGIFSSLEHDPDLKYVEKNRPFIYIKYWQILKGKEGMIFF